MPAGGEADVPLVYTLDEPCRAAYTEYRGRLTLVRDGREITGTDLWFSAWPVAIDLRLGALYLAPEQRQFVRMNLGLSAVAVATLASVRLEIVRRGSGRVLHTLDVPATAAVIAAQRERIPGDLRGDLTNLLLADLDVSALPVQPFDDPQRNWIVRATALDLAGRAVARAESPPFCRQAHAAPQPAISQVTVGPDNLLRVNGEPWMPWGAVYGFAPAYAGPADPGPEARRDLHALPAWSMYDRFTGEGYTREKGFNCARRSTIPRPSPSTRRTSTPTSSPWWKDRARSSGCGPRCTRTCPMSAGASTSTRS